MAGQCARWRGIAILLALTTGMARAEESVGARISEYVTFGGEVRARYEMLDDFDVDKRSSDANDMVFMRTRLGVTFDATPTISARIELQDQRRWGDWIDGAAGTAAPNAPNFDVGSNSSNQSDRADIVLHEGYILLAKILWNEKFDVKFGRQTMSYGDERVLGELDWSSRGGRAHDGEVITFRATPNQKYDFLYVVREENDNLPTAGGLNGNTTSNSDADAVLYGIYGDIKLSFLNRLQPYWIYESYDRTTAANYVPQIARAENTALGSNTGDYKAHTYGFLLAGEFLGRWAYDFEGNIQTGDFGAMTLDAYMYHGMLGFATRWNHLEKIAVAYDAYSGDDNASDRDMNTYQPIFPSIHEHIGRIGWFGMKNLNRLRLSGKGELIGKWRWMFDWHRYGREAGNDHYWEPDGSRWFGGAQFESHENGNEYDLEFRYLWDDNITWLLSGSLFQPGEGLSKALARNGRDPGKAGNVISQIEIKF